MYSCRGKWTTAKTKADWPPLTKALQDYQDPSKTDKISAIQKELDDTTAVLVSEGGYMLYLIDVYVVDENDRQCVGTWRKIG